MARDGLRLVRSKNWDSVVSQYEMAGTLAIAVEEKAMIEVAKRAQLLIKVFLERGGVTGPRTRHQLTYDTRGHKDPALRSTGELFRNVKIKKLANNSLFIGWDEEPDVTKAASTEFGAVIKVTPKIRAYFAWKKHPLRLSTKVLRIPARKFLLPAGKAIFDDTDLERQLLSMMMAVTGTKL